MCRKLRAPNFSSARKVTGLNGSGLNTMVANGGTADGCRTHNVLYALNVTEKFRQIYVIISLMIVNRSNNFVINS
jgi:hypothetical protein